MSMFMLMLHIPCRHVMIVHVCHNGTEELHQKSRLYIYKVIRDNKFTKGYPFLSVCNIEKGAESGDEKFADPTISVRLYSVSC